MKKPMDGLPLTPLIVAAMWMACIAPAWAQQTAAADNGWAEAPKLTAPASNIADANGGDSASPGEIDGGLAGPSFSARPFVPVESVAMVSTTVLVPQTQIDAGAGPTSVVPAAAPTTRLTMIPTTFMSTTQAATQPEEQSAVSGNFPSPGEPFGLEEFALHFAPYEPMYFLGGWQAPNIKFQFSFRYRIITPTGPLATEYPWLKGFNFAYSQTSLWDWSNPSNPFFYDSSYRPEVFYYLESIPGLKLPRAWQVGFQTGVGHESNGQGGVNERSLNIAYFRPVITFSDESRGSRLFLTLSPKFFDYITSLPDNPQMPRYRGYAEVEMAMGQRDGLQLAIDGYVGDHLDRGSAQFDLTYPLTKVLHGNMDMSLDAQYFIGYGESLINYTQRSSIFRIGLNLVR